MRQYGRTIGIVVISALLLASFSLHPTLVSAQSESTNLSDAQRSHIRSECTQIKGSLSQLHATDALLRVNRGQVYESLVNKLMAPFNGRLSSAGLDNKAMATHIEQYQTALTAFRTDYITYEKKIAELLRTDCSSEPTKFYQLVLDARERRKTVHEDVVRLHQIIDDYGNSVSDFLLNYKRLSD